MTNMIDKIRQLRAIGGNALTEAEAMTMMAQADRLMAKHGITEADLNKADVEERMAEKRVKYKQKQTHPFVKYVLMSIGRFCEVKVWNSPDDRAGCMFGMDGDVEMAEFLADMIHKTMDRAWKEYIAVTPPPEGMSRHRQYWGFMSGMGNRLAERLDELTAQRERVSAGDGTDLVVKKMAVVEKGFETALGFKLHRSKSRGITIDGDAKMAGRAAGDRVNLNRPMGGAAGAGRKQIS